MRTRMTPKIQIASMLLSSGAATERALFACIDTSAVRQVHAGSINLPNPAAT
jgi:hypothetical protein